MKDIKTFLIGFLTCACLMLIMGATAYNTGNGKYEMMTSFSGKSLYLLETETSEVYVWNGEADRTWHKFLAPISD